jgi:hypothetical protein
MNGLITSTNILTNGSSVLKLITFCTTLLLSLCSISAHAADEALTKLFDDADKIIFDAADSFKGEPNQIPTLLASDVPQKLETIFVNEWPRLTAKIDADLEALPDISSKTLQPAVKTIDIKTLEAGMPVSLSTASAGKLIFLRFYDITHVATLGSSIILSGYLSSAEDFSREAILWGFTSTRIFKTTVNDISALGIARGNWVTVTTYQRTENGLLKPIQISLHPRFAPPG